MAVTDASVTGWINTNAGFLHWLMPVCAMLMMVMDGKWLTARVRAPRIDLLNETDNKAA